MAAQNYRCFRSSSILLSIGCSSDGESNVPDCECSFLLDGLLIGFSETLLKRSAFGWMVVVSNLRLLICPSFLRSSLTVALDLTLSFSRHEKIITQSCYCQLCQIHGRKEGVREAFPPGF